MGFLFRKRLRLGKFLSLNLSKSGLGLSVGPPGAKLSVNPKRARIQVGIPGTGLGYRRDVSMPQEGGEPSIPTRRHGRAWLIMGLLVALMFLVYLLSGCGFAQWRDQALRDVAEGRWHVNPEQVPPGSAPSQTIEFYDAGGKHVGYGKVQGGTAEFFNTDGSRTGSGKVGR
ncbi:MAG: DUF4236 domain-containing protein [candidate division NC10 bacterium]|nr:DUF4236 domain-containing protein [candidate division NC10 bacterium]MDE2320662.1 DUF4236 domain-containing protein [candidate division NC10 bacterium]